MKKVLSETASMMISEDYKERFKAEYEQTRIRYAGLSKMIHKWHRGELEFTPTCNEEIFQRQLTTMYKYLGILEERAILEEIDLFN